MHRCIVAITILLVDVMPQEIAAAVERKPNVIILFTDDRGTLDVNCYGSNDLHKPHMACLAAVRFAQAYAHTVCCAARAMLRLGVTRSTAESPTGPSETSSAIESQHGRDGSHDRGVAQGRRGFGLSPLEGSPRRP